DGEDDGRGVPPRGAGAGGGLTREAEGEFMCGAHSSVSYPAYPAVPAVTPLIFETTGTIRSGRSVISPSTPQSSSRSASATVSTVHTCTPSPARCASATNRGETTRVRPASSGT